MGHTRGTPREGDVEGEDCMDGSEKRKWETRTQNLGHTKMGNRRGGGRRKKVLRDY